MTRISKPFSLTDKQAECRDILAGPEMHNLGVGGSRSGKTFLFCYCTANRALMAPGSRHLIARHHNVDVRQSIMMDTWPKMMKLAFPGVPWTLNKSDQFATFPVKDGEEPTEIWFGGLDDADRVDKILGKEFATIYVSEASQVAYDTILTLRTRLAQNAFKRNGRLLKLKEYIDLNPTGQGHWSFREFIKRVRPDNDEPLAPGNHAHFFLNPADNPHLQPAYLAMLAAMPEHKRKRFLEGVYQAEVPGALWSLANIEKNRRSIIPDLTRIVVAIDPSGSDGTGGDLQGIIVLGLGVDGRCYVLEDGSCQFGPAGWARRVVDLYNKWQADTVVAEINYGGAMVEHTIKTQDKSVAVKVVTASRGKHLRAEPISSLYAENKVSHVGVFRELEDQLSMFNTSGYQGGDSPDRADALVWGASELMLGDGFDLNQYLKAYGVAA